MATLRQQGSWPPWNGQRQWFNGGVSESMTSPETGEIRVNEVYRDYTPPVNASAVVHELLKQRAEQVLAGLKLRRVNQ